jgi:hypothetical protein
MSDSNQPPVNYPDLLGYITGSARANINVVQLALAVRPRVVRAGRPFEAILLVQNASDVNVDVTATLSLPEQDAKKQKDRFLTKNNRLLVGIRPAEVGYVVLPLSCLPDTAVSEDYKIGMEVTVKPLKKPNRIRLTEGGGEVVLEHLHDDIKLKLDDLKKLNFSTSKRFALRDVIEASFGVMPGRLGQIVDLQPGWVSLWTRRDYVDKRHLSEQFAPAMLEKVLPRMKKAVVFEPLLQATRERFDAAGYPLEPLEALFITKMLTFILEMAMPEEQSVDYLGNSHYNVALALKKGEDEPSLPRWANGLLHAIAQDEKHADTPEALIAGSLYDELVLDAIPHAFAMIKTITGEDMGDTAEIEEYSNYVVRRLVDQESSNRMDFTHAYMPLIISGVIVYDRVLQSGEDVSESLRGMHDVLVTRESEMDDNNDIVFKLTREMVNRSLQKFGFRI